MLKDITNFSSTLKAESAFNKNYSSNELLNLKCPNDFYYNLTRQNIKIFEEYFNQRYSEIKIRKNVMDTCILAANGNIFENEDFCWFNEKKFCE